MNLAVMGVLLAVVGVTAGHWLLPNAPVPAAEDGAAVLAARAARC